MVLASFLAGNLAVSSFPSMSVPKYGSLNGKVILRSGHSALLNTTHGRIWASFTELPPEPGTSLIARIKPSSSKMNWVGDVDENLYIRRARATPRRVVAWEALYTDRLKPKLDETKYKDMKNGAISWALVSGDRRSIQPEKTELFRRTGVSHLLAISGMHIGMLSAFTYGMAKLALLPLIWKGWLWVNRIPPVLGFLAAMSYALYSGWSAASQRALWMVGIAMLCLILGRRLRPGLAVSSAACVILAVEPAHFGTLGFSLSFAAIAGILCLSPRIIQRFPKGISTVSRSLLKGMAVSTAACVGTLPLTAVYFQTFAWVAPLTNLLAVPLTTFVILPGSVIGGLLPQSIAILPLSIVDGAISLLFFVLQLMDSEPLITAASPMAALLLGAVIFLTRRLWLVFLVSTFIFFRPPERPSDFRLSILPVGQGDGALLEWPDGTRWLIDAGPSSRSLRRYLHRRRIRRLDAVILSHPHPDHFGAMIELLPHFEIGGFWAPRAPESKETQYRMLWRLLDRLEIQKHGPDEPLGMESSIVHPTAGWSATGSRRVNEESLVLSVFYGGRRLLMTGDIEAQAEKHLATVLGTHDILKVPHHGSRSSSSESFLEAISPQIALISCGRNNRFRHPHPEALSRLSGTSVFRTDQRGIIHVLISNEGEMVVIDGKQKMIYSNLSF